MVLVDIAVSSGLPDGISDRHRQKQQVALVPKQAGNGLRNDGASSKQREQASKHC